MLVLVPILLAAVLFITASFAPVLWRRSMWGLRPRRVYRPIVRHHGPMHFPRRRW